ncbi:uncharacterized protein LOC26534621 isoform X1 [Drosophila yakuba]|uniref:uncharacterized protein LOC26534621 isoform X1 n=1 Tax=Drosophila yakuba TaxID=7245 RepID=UPI0019308489|nr:uncharacterized protein LOC26534621 isoform X1 [Drosophila yakuba]
MPSSGHSLFKVLLYFKCFDMKACFQFFSFSGTIARSDIANCVLDYNPICVVHEDCGFTLNSKCLLDLHKNVFYHKNQATFESFISGPCPKDKQKCPYKNYLSGKTFDNTSK